MAGQVWAVNSQGGFMYSDNLTNDFRNVLQPTLRFRQFADVKEESVGLHRGDTFHWNVYGDVSESLGGALVETNTMPEGGFTITQGTLTIGEYGLAVPWTKKLDDLSYHPVREIVTNALKNHARKTFDTQAANKIDTVLLRVVPTAGTSTSALTLTTNGTATLTNNVAFGKAHARLVATTMKERDIPAFVGDDYYALARPSTLDTFKGDLEGIRQYVDAGFGMIMNGEIGRYDGIRYVQQTHVSAGGLGTASAAWTNGLSDWIVFTGEDALVEGCAIPEEVRANLPGDFGRSRAIAWYFVGGWAIPHTVAAQGRTVIWDSAA